MSSLRRENVALVQLLGLCPLLAVSTHLAYALGLAIASTLVLVISNVCVSLIARGIATEIRIVVFVIVIAAAVGIVERLVQAFAYPLYQALGIFLPLIVTNCAILGRAEAFASRNGVRDALLDALKTGAGFCVVLLAMGTIREILGRGTLFAEMDRLLGSWASGLEMVIADRGLLLIALPPGAFLVLAGLIALNNLIGSSTALSEPRPAAETREPS